MMRQAIRQVRSLIRSFTRSSYTRKIQLFKIQISVQFPVSQLNRKKQCGEHQKNAIKSSLLTTVPQFVPQPTHLQINTNKNNNLNTPFRVRQLHQTFGKGHLRVAFFVSTIILSSFLRHSYYLITYHKHYCVTLQPMLIKTR